jgi:hypothetical protein
MSNRAARRAAQSKNRRSVRTGEWQPWQSEKAPRDCGHAGRGWFGELDRAWSNGIYAVMSRAVQTQWGEVEHVCIRNVGNSDIPWRDKQRIKDELFGADRVAVEVFPESGDLVDDAGMYHLWILPAGYRLPFSLKEQAA